MGDAQEAPIRDSAALNRDTVRRQHFTNCSRGSVCGSHADCLIGVHPCARSRKNGPECRFGAFRRMCPRTAPAMPDPGEAFDSLPLDPVAAHFALDIGDRFEVVFPGFLTPGQSRLFPAEVAGPHPWTICGRFPLETGSGAPGARVPGSAAMRAGAG